ncbi:MAG: DUF302 domain-containing protein [Nitrospinae bacterium]|nr:DUF302 domain-containing protein [Nitrospinota bacterium]
MNRNPSSVKISVASIVFSFVVALAYNGVVNADDYFVSIKSKHDFNTTVTNIKKQTAANKLVLLKEYNVQMMLKMVGVNAEKSMTMAIFHPRYGKVIYANDKNAMSATPLRLIVQERGGDVIVAYIRPSAIFANFDLPKSMTDELDTLLGSVVKNATN